MWGLLQQVKELREALERIEKMAQDPDSIDYDWIHIVWEAQKALGKKVECD